MSKSPHTPERRAMVAQEHSDESGSSYDLAIKYGIHAKTIRRWAVRYKE